MLAVASMPFVSGLSALRGSGVTGLSVMLEALCTCLNKELQGASGFFVLLAPALDKAVLSV